jgi:glycosyltransferase involved in cell wall biosynthesis
MRIALFDWVAGGHHPIYMQRFAQALRAEAEVVVAAPEETIRQIDDDSLPTVSLGLPRPDIPRRRQLAADWRKVMRNEVRLLERVVDESDPDHLVHLGADAVLPYLVRRPQFRRPVTVLIFYPRAHYPTAFQTPLRLGERTRANAKELLIGAWRRRKDSHALLTLDEEAAQRWRTRRGATAYWIPEPPVLIPDAVDSHERRGCIVYGALAERKGIDLVADAVALSVVSLHVTIAGESNPAFLPRLNELVTHMRRAGATVDLRLHRHTETEGLRALARAKCALLTYPLHNGMSRVLLEACAVGTPVIVHNRGLLGYLVRRHGIGEAVDCRDPVALRRAILELTDGAAGRYDDSLARFASRYSRERFQQKVLGVFRDGEDADDTALPMRSAARAG